MRTIEDDFQHAVELLQDLEFEVNAAYYFAEFGEPYHAELTLVKCERISQHENCDL
jgi:hypothetical protein